MLIFYKKLKVILFFIKKLKVRLFEKKKKKNWDKKYKVKLFKKKNQGAGFGPTFLLVTSDWAPLGLSRPNPL